MFAQQFQHILPASHSLSDTQQGQWCPFAGRGLQTVIEEVAEVVVREIVPIDFKFVDVHPVEMVWQTQLEEPIEVVSHL